jgi:putative SOS response-associated peptidase YedK
MCGRYVSSSSVAVLESYLAVDEVRTEPLEEKFNVAPTDKVYAVVQREDKRILGALEWGLVPWFSKERKSGAKMINARAESVASKPAFRRAFERRRCLIPADGFYEWKRRPDQPKQPYFISGADGRPLVFAGLWEVWRESDDAEPVRTCTIITTSANELLKPIHDRMPVVLAPERWDEWLDPAITEPDLLGGLLVPAPDDLFALRPVSTRVNSVRNDGPDLIDPIPS